MNAEQQEPMSITVGDQTFRVRVAPEERERFVRIARSANLALQDILDGGVVGGPRALAMAVFQLAVELEDTREALRASRAAVDDRLRGIVNRIDDALDTILSA